ncbi:MAG TPA: aldo/keto reductase [Dehalococcoidia bacterium]|nr:aldo/keto reductase [Dehalococcoidia bacterium]
MKTTRLGATDLAVSNLCLGTMQFGWTADERASSEVLDAFVAAGGNFIDTADIYSRWAKGNHGGEAEEIVGRWLQARGNRRDVVVATKVRGEMWKGADGEGLSRAHITRAVEDSLRRLQIDTIDLYQCHWPDEGTPIEETLAVFGELIAAGKVRYIGASNYSAAQLRAALDTASVRGLPAFATLQPHHNLVHRAEYEEELAALCVTAGIGVIPYSPLAGGFLTGKYRKGQPLPASQRAGGVKKYLNDEGYAVVDALAGVAGSHGTTIAAAALAWELTRPGIQSPIIGANSTDQLSALLPGAELALAADEIAALDAASVGR